MNIVFFAVGLAIGALIFLFIAFIAGAHFALVSGDDFRELRKVFRTRQFGLMSIVASTTIVGLAMVFLRMFGIRFDNIVPDEEYTATIVGAGIGFCGAAALVLATAVVGSLWMLVAGRVERQEVQRVKEHLRHWPDTFVAPVAAGEAPVPETSATSSLVAQVPLAQIAVADVVDAEVVVAEVTNADIQSAEAPLVVVQPPATALRAAESNAAGTSSEPERPTNEL